MLIAGLAVLSTGSVAHAQDPETGTAVTMWGKTGDVATVPNPKAWKHRQSCITAWAQVTCETPIGSATAADPDLDDSGWRDFTAVGPKPKMVVGPNVGNHFRKDFTIAQSGYEPYQIVGIRFQIHYDDTAVVYLNGTEVYRSVRGNLDPEYEAHEQGYPGCFEVADSTCDIPHDVPIPYGGHETIYIGVPNYLGTNLCEVRGGNDAQCTTGPYGGPNPPEAPIDLLDANGNGAIEAHEVSTWGVTVWNRQASGDASFDHTFDLIVDPDAAPPSGVRINEVAASNDTGWLVDLDGDGNDESPDWIELHNTATEAVDIGGWTITDSSASFTIPNYTIEPDEYLMIAASDCVPAGQPTGSCAATSPMQANFKISSRGESLTLTSDDAVQQDVFAEIPQQFTDGTYGRPGDDGDPTYLDSPTPGRANSAAGQGYDPVLRLFADRIYNVGETISNRIDAFDPDGADLSYSVAGVTGLSVTTDAAGVSRITGTAGQSGTRQGTITVRETADSTASASQAAKWTYVQAAPGGSPLVLNEYNAVSDSDELIAGVSPVGNGGDWFEFLVVEDALDLRGWSIELYDNKGKDDQLRQAATLTFTDSPALAVVPAGTLIVIGEEVDDDLSFDPQSQDWTISLKVDAVGNGAFFAESNTNTVFNSTRTDQKVLIKDAQGVVRVPLSGETDAWDNAHGGVGSQEVMNLCVNPITGAQIDPVGDYRDNGHFSTRGEPNKCVWSELADPADPASAVERTFDQDLSALRSSGASIADNDPDCSGATDIGDAWVIARFVDDPAANSRSCWFNPGPAGIYLGASDVTGDGSVDDDDAISVLECLIGTPNSLCP